MFKIIVLLCALLSIGYLPKAEAGVGIPGHSNGPTPFQSIFATGFSGSYNTYGTGTTAGAIGAYGRFVSGGASGAPHGGGGGYGK